MLALNAFIDTLTKQKPTDIALSIMAHIEEMNVFIVDPKLVNLPPEDEEQNLTPPFKTCWFQYPEQTTEQVGKIEIRGNYYLGCFVHEQNDKLLFCHFTGEKSPPKVKLFTGTISCISNSPHARAMASWLNALDGSLAGTMKSSERIKYKNPSTKQKILHKIRQVIMVYPKKLNSQQREFAKVHNIDFSHRFSVRGHWRKIAGIGKNRQGEYCIDGKTYVSEFEKGPSKAPLIHKTRILRRQ